MEINRESVHSCGFRSLLLAFCLGLLQVDEIPVHVFSCPFPEPLLLLLVWMIADVGFLLLRASDDYINVCDIVSSYISVAVADTLSYAGLVYPLRWCLQLEAGPIPGYLSSWTSFYGLIVKNWMTAKDDRERF